ncbi:DsbA family protein [Methylovirgula sp. 4M-Z18]|uniref:DsbA family protein n=1 Tax=Methylovirgula sp. 4M-Z18 TaxID=2293567 RepID=UPI001FE17A5C|nr:DsbA family protein [Methylovirgula sp. 4M-Z18]
MSVAALSAGIAFAPLTAKAQSFTDAQKDEIGKVVHDYLIAHPEVLRDAMIELDKRQKADEAANQQKVISNSAATLFNSPNQAVLGNPNGKVTLVEFFDYNCGYCKHALADLAQVMKQDPDVRVVLKDFPVLGPGSVEAARVAYAVRNQFTGEKFWEFHQKLLGSRGPVGKAQAMAVAKDMGADMDRIEKDSQAPSVNAGLNETLQLGDALSLTGTPSYVVGHSVIVGAVGYDALQQKIKDAQN